MLRRLSLALLIAASLAIAPAAHATEPVALTADQLTLVNAARTPTLPAWLSTADRALAAQSAELCKQGKSTESNAVWQTIVRSNVPAHSVDQLDGVSRWIVRTCHLANKPDLLDKAVKAGVAGDLYADTRAWVGVLKTKLAAFPPPPATSVTIPIKALSGGRLVDQGSKLVTRDGLKSMIAQLEPQLQKAGDDAQLANLNLQNALQSYQQAVQTIANIMKVMRDDAMSIIRNLRS